MRVQVFSSVVCESRAGTAGDFLFSFLRNHRAVFPSDLQSRSPDLSDLSVVLSSATLSYLFFDAGPRGGREVASRCGFDLHLPDAS